MAFRRKRRRKDEGSHESRALRAMGAFVVACLLVASGFVLRGNDAFLVRMGLDSFAVDAEQNPGATVSGNTFDSISARVAEVQGVLADKSLDTFDLDAVTRVLLGDFLKQTGDPYARYYDTQEYLAYREAGAGGAYGVGVLFGDYRNQAYAVDLIPGSSAQAAGVEVGDFVVAVDGVRKEGGWTLAEVLSQVEREEGGTVVVSWRRPASLESTGGEEFTTTLVCSPAAQENVTSELLGDEVGYVKVRQLGRTTATSVSAAVRGLAADGAGAYVLDLRDCPGGYLSQAVEVASIFQGSGVVVQIQAKNGLTTRSAAGTAQTGAPLVILVNGNTAAAAEVLAAGLQDNDRALVVGQPTMGKGTVQVMEELSFGGAISYTAAEYLSPLGRSLDGSGVSPNIVAENMTGESGQDIQLSLALEAAVAARMAG